MTTPSITTAPTMASFERPSQWDDEMMAFLEWMQALPPELNALVPFLALAAAPGGVAMVYKFATATSGDPGPGYVRLNNATQASATAINLDLVDANGIDVSTLLARVATGTSAVKGELKLVKVGDPNTWISFEATSATSPSGYRSVVLQNGVGVPTSSPFAAEDQVYAVWSRAGDKGDTGATGPNGPWTQIGSTQTISGTPSSVTFSSISTNYADLMLDASSLSYSTTATLNISVSPDGSAFSSAQPISTTTALQHALMLVSGYRLDRSTIRAEALTGSLANNTVSDSAIPTAGRLVARCDGGISAIRLSPSTGTFTGGTLKLFGR